MPSASTLYDLPSLAAGLPVEIGRSVPRFPFLAQGDRTTRIYDRTYWQAARYYEPGQPGVTRDTAPTSPEAGIIYDPQAFLLRESAPGPLGLGELVRFTRTFGRIPPTLYDPADRLIQRPSLDGVVSGTTYAVSFDDDATAHIFPSGNRKTIASIASLTDEGSKAVTGTTSGTGTLAGTGTVGGSGTVAGTKQAFSPDTLPSATVSWGDSSGSTGSFNLSTTPGSSIESDLRTAGVIAQVVKTDTSLSITVLATTTDTIRYMTTSSAEVDLQSSGSSFTFTRRKTSAYADVTDTRSTTDTRATLDTRATTDTHAVTETYLPGASVRAFTTTGNHGAAVGDSVAFWQGTRLVAKSVVITQNGTTGFTCLLADVPGADFAAATVGFSSGASARYVCGTISATCRLVRRFYLPDYTAGIATMADIPNFTPVTDPVSWLGAILAYAAAPSPSTYAVIETASMQRYEDSPIIEKSVVEVQLADVVTSVAV